MPVVSDTSPILGLSAIGLLNLLKAQFDSVFIPQAVLEELEVETNFRGTSTIQNALKNGWLEPRDARSDQIREKSHGIFAAGSWLLYFRHIIRANCQRGGGS